MTVQCVMRYAAQRKQICNNWAAWASRE